MPIYTKKGDKGQTSLRSGRRIWKDNVRVDTYGTTDEMNAFLGVIASGLGETARGWKKYLRDILLKVQYDMFYVGAYLANPDDPQVPKHFTKRTKYFEDEIDKMTQQMPPLANFILPSGGRIGAELQYARTLARRAERRLVTLVQKEEVDDTVIAYINRLSDLFFTMSRYSNFKEKKKEIIWKPKKG